MLLRLFLTCFWIQLISGWDYKAKLREPVTPVVYKCPVPPRLNKKNLLLVADLPNKKDPLLYAIQENFNINDYSDDVFTTIDAQRTFYNNHPESSHQTTTSSIKFFGYVDPPPTEDELLKYEYNYSTPFTHEWRRNRIITTYLLGYGSYYIAHVHLANRLPFVRTENYCTGWKFFSCFYFRENFWYEGELQYYFQEWFQNDLYVIVATDKVYFSWLQFIKKMQIRAAVVLRASKIAKRPVPYIVNAVKRLTCHFTKPKHNGQNSIYYSLSMEMLLSQTDLNVAKNGPGFPYIIVAVPMRLSKDSMTFAKKFYAEQSTVEMMGFFSSMFKSSKMDFVFFDTESRRYQLFEIYDTQRYGYNFGSQSRAMKRILLEHVKDTGKTLNNFNLTADLFTKLIRKNTRLHSSYVVAPVVITFSEVPTLFTPTYDDFPHKKQVLSFIRELKQADAHAVFINSQTDHFQRKVPIKDTDVDVSVFPVYPHPLHLIYEMFLITRDHVIDRISQVMRVDKQQLTFDTNFTLMLPESKLNGAFLDLMAMIPEKSVNSDVLLAKEYFTENGALSTYEYLQNFLRPRELKIGETSFSNYLNEEVVADCGASNMLFPVKTTIVENTQQDVQAGEVPIKHLNFEKCLSKFFWSSVSYKVAVIFVDTLTKDWVDAASEATAAFATQGLRREGMIIFVSSNIPAELQEHREKNVYTIDSAVCSDIKQCVLDRIFYSKLVNG